MDTIWDEKLKALGLVRIQLLVPAGPGVQEPTIWWVGQKTAALEVAAGRAVYA